MAELGVRYGKSSMGLPEDSSRHHIVGKNIGYRGRITSCIAGPYTVQSMEFHHSWGPSKHFPLSSPYRQSKEACTARDSYCQKHIHRKTANKHLEQRLMTSGPRRSFSRPGDGVRKHFGQKLFSSTDEDLPGSNRRIGLRKYHKRDYEDQCARPGVIPTYGRGW